MKKIISLLLTVAMLFSLGFTALAEESARGGTVRLEESSGTVTVKNASGKSQTIRKSMRLYNGYALSTGRSSEAYVSLDDTKVVKLDASTKVDVKQAGKQLEVSLASGKLFFNVTRPLAADETLNIVTSTMVTGIRGSYGWVTPREVGLMHGRVTVTCRNPYTGETRVTELKSGERVYFDPDPQGWSSDPELLEIDFVKEPIRNEDVPLVVVREMAKDKTGLCAPVIADVETVNVPKLLEELPEMETAARAEEESALKAMEAALKAEETSLTGDGVDQVFAGGSVSVSPPSPTTYTVTFNTGGGSAVASQVVTAGSTPTAPSAPTRTGYTFTGWYGDSACTVSYDFTASVTGDTTVYAGWAINSYTVSFNAGGHGTAPAAQTVVYNTYATEPAALTETGWTFGGWYADTTVTTPFAFTTTPITGNTTLYAKWTINSYTVSFDAGGHGTPPAAQTVDYNGYAAEPAALTETGWSFGGWYADAALTKVFDFTAVPIVDNTTVYARWTQVFGGTGLSNAPDGSADLTEDMGDLLDGSTKTLTDIATLGWSYPGYTFDGWNTAADGSGTAYADGAAVPVSGDVTLYAQWTYPQAIPSGSTFSVWDADGNEVTGTTVTLSAGDHGTAVHSFTVRQPNGEAAADFAVGPDFAVTGATVAAAPAAFDPVNFSFTVTGGPTAVNVDGLCYSGGGAPADGAEIETRLDTYGSVILTDAPAAAVDFTIDAGQSLTVNAPSGSPLSIGTLTNNGSLTFAGSTNASITAASVNNGSLTVESGASLALTSTLDSAAGCAITNRGTFSTNGTTTELTVDGTFTNEAGAQFEMTGNSSVSISAGGSFVNAGTLTVSDYGTRFGTNSFGDFTNESSGTVDVDDQATFGVNGVTINDGVIRLNAAPTKDTTGGLYYASGTFLNNGSVIVEANRLMQLLYQMEFTNSAGAVVTVEANGEARFNLNGSAIKWLNEGTITNDGILGVSIADTDPRPVNHGQIVNTASLLLGGAGLDSYAGTIDNSGTITNDAGPIYYDVTNNGAIGGTVSGTVTDSPAP